MTTTETGSVVRLRAIVEGKVQGVGYRYWVHHAAKRFGLSGGVVRNLSDGTVEVIAEAGERMPLEGLWKELHIGPAEAQVTAVGADWEENTTARYGASDSGELRVV